MRGGDPQAIAKLMAKGEASAARGDHAGARKQFEIAAKHSTDWRIRYRAGMNEAAAGQFHKAVHWLIEARRSAGGDPNVDANLGQMLLLADRPQEALAPLEAAARSAPGVVQIQLMLADALAGSDRAADAETAYKRVLQTAPATLRAHNNLAVLLRDQGRLSEAAGHLERAAEGGDAEAIGNLGNAYRAMGRTDAAVSALTRASKTAPGQADLHRNLAIAQREHGDIAGADRSTKRAITLSPDVAVFAALLAETAEQRADGAHAARHASWALALEPGHVDATRVISRRNRREGKAAEAADIIQNRMNAFGGTGAGSHRLWFELGQALDALGDTKEAYAAFETANAQQMEALGPNGPDPERAHAQIAALTDALSQKAATAPAHESADPVFLVGFPRSGTTLLDQILDAHPQVRVLEEKPLITATIGRVRTLGLRYPEDLHKLSEDAVATLRDAYLSDRDTFLTRGSGDVFVDKMPLNIVHAALIRRLFPSAKFLLALRHPCDVCLSCFMQSFELNDWMAGFGTLEGAARLYQATMGFWRRAAETLSLPHHIVRYEDLVADLEGEGEAAAAFLGVPWDDGMARFHEHARSRRLGTPSAGQVTRPLYQSSVARWRRYAFATDAIHAMLAGDIAAFGYAEAEATPAAKETPP